MAQTITANLQALVNDIFYHYSEQATTETIEFGSIYKYALVLRDWTGKTVASNISGQPDSVYAGGPAVIFCNDDAENDFDPAVHKVFWDKVRTTGAMTFDGATWSGGTNEVDYIPYGSGVQSNINAGMYSKLDSDGAERSGYPENVIYDNNVSIPTYGTFSVFPALTTWDRGSSSFTEETNNVTQLDDKWGITYGFQATQSISISQDHFGYPTKWEFWFKTREDSPEGDTSQGGGVGAGQGPIFPWGNSGLTEAAGYWLGAHGDITQKQIVSITGDNFTNIENNISDGDFVFTPYLSTSHDDSGESGYREAFVDSNDGIEELYWRFDISESVSGSGSDGGEWTDKALAQSLMPVSSKPTARPQYNEFIPNRILIYKNTSITTEQQLKTLRAGTDPANASGNPEIAVLAASGVFDVSTAGLEDGQDGWNFYPLVSNGSSTVPLIDGISLHANRPHFSVGGPGGILFESTDLQIEVDELPMVLVLERILKSDGNYFTRAEMRTKFDNWGVAGMTTYDGSGGLTGVSHVERLIYNVSASQFNAAGKSWEANSPLNLYLQWGKKPTINTAGGQVDGTYHPAKNITTNYKSGWLDSSHDHEVEPTSSA